MFETEQKLIRCLIRYPMLSIRTWISQTHAPARADTLFNSLALAKNKKNSTTRNLVALAFDIQSTQGCFPLVPH